MNRKIIYMESETPARFASYVEERLGVLAFRTHGGNDEIKFLAGNVPALLAALNQHFAPPPPGGGPLVEIADPLPAASSKLKRHTVFVLEGATIAADESRRQVAFDRPGHHSLLFMAENSPSLIEALSELHAEYLARGES